MDDKQRGILLGVGWMYAEACNLADKGIDIRHEEAPGFVERALGDLQRKGDADVSA